MSKEALRSAFENLKAGEKALARIELRALLDKEPDNADAWWLMAHALTEPDEIRQALQQDLRLRPDHRAAQEKLDALNRKYPPTDHDADDDFERWLALENVPRLQWITTR